MSIHLVTGRGTGDHVTSADAGSLHAGIVGTGRYVLNRGSQFAYEVISNNLVKIKDGDLLNQGRHVNIAVNDYEECTIENGLQSVKRNDLIVIRYEKNTETEIETASVVVIKGTSGDTAVDPEYIIGNILSGDTTDDFPLYRVRLNGINIEGVDALFTVQKSIKDLADSLGSTDISAIGSGSVTGAINTLNSRFSLVPEIANMFYPDNPYGTKVITDLNSIAISGCYVADVGAVGSPNAAYAWFVYHHNSASNTNYSYQKVIAFAPNLIIYERIKSGGSWNAWHDGGNTSVNVFSSLVPTNCTLAGTVIKKNGVAYVSLSIQPITTGAVVVNGFPLKVNKWAHNFFIGNSTEMFVGILNSAGSTGGYSFTASNTAAKYTSFEYPYE